MRPGPRRFAALALTALLACTEAPTEPVALDVDVRSNARGGQAKVQVCHRQGEGGWNLITVGLPGVAAHKAHGDAEPGEAVPGSGDTQVFGPSCEVLPDLITYTFSGFLHGVADDDNLLGSQYSVGDPFTGGSRIPAT